MKHSTEKIEIDNSSWFRHWFDSSFYHSLYGHRNEKEAANFINELIEELRPKQNSSMLDLGCGNGRHSKWLSAKGFNVTGLDLAASSIRIAKKFETDSLKFYRHDMRVPFGKNCFDYVFNFFTSFGYFKNDQENHQVINNIFNSLSDNGILVMDYLNVQYAEVNLIPLEKREIDGIIYHIERWTDKKFFFKKITIENMQGEKPIEYIEQVARFSLFDFDLMFKRNGLQIQKLFGDYDLNQYNSETSPRLIMMVKKLK
jgi:SAM-dependent methyltransferase